tara:strand:- start:13 stop:885 length:873 start_codon:yes stop_codon:yes gene_type:complete
MFKKNKIKKKVLEQDDTEYTLNKLKLNTGDIVLFKSNKGIISKVINFWTQSDYIHVGIVIKNVDLFLDNGKSSNESIEDNQYGLLESGYEDVFDMAENNYKYGVQITPLKEKIENYDGVVFFRSLKFESKNPVNYQDLTYNLFNAYNEIKNKPYDLDLLDLFNLRNDFCNVDFDDSIDTPILNNNDDNNDNNNNNNDNNDNNNDNTYSFNFTDIGGLRAFKSWFKHDNQKMDKFVCSSLVAFIYTKLSLLPEKTLWTEWIPVYFSDKNKNLELLGPVKLMNERKYIKKNK